MTLVLSFPVLALVIAAYVALGLTPGLMLDPYSVLYLQTLSSGADFALSVGDGFVLAGLVALFIEMLKAGRAGRGAIIDHMLSTATFIAALVCFLLVGFCGTSTFFILTVMALIDVVAGFSVSLLSARRDMTVGL